MNENKIQTLGCQEPFVPTFDFRTNNIKKTFPGNNKYSQKYFYDTVQHKKENTKDKEIKPHKRLKHHLQILNGHNGKYGYFD